MPGLKMIERLRQRLTEAGVISEDVSSTEIVVRAIHNTVGNIAIELDEDEFTVMIGKYYHTHFDKHDKELDNITTFVTDFIVGHSILTLRCRGSEVLSARLDNTQTGFSSVVAHCREEPSFLSRLTSVVRKKRESSQSYKWSGPVPLFIPQQSEEETNIQGLAEATSGLSADELNEVVRELEKRCAEQDKEN